MLSNHRKKCLSCSRSGNCELQALCRELGVDDENVFDGVMNEYEIDVSAKHMYRDNNKCISCRRCVAACAKTQGIGVIGANNRGFKTEISCAFDMDLADSACVSCGQCIAVCPTGALSEKDDTDKVWAALSDPTKTVVVQTAPAVRASLGEAFGYPMGTDVEESLRLRFISSASIMFLIRISARILRFWKNPTSFGTCYKRRRPSDDYLLLSRLDPLL